ncbi:hypothetical protein MPSEU_000159400 [Mayamaea pseudoterrestris]|nr:hypothetical protein MPSEU_000159400 [Mayamaea pseudoterrestris]
MASPPSAAAENDQDETTAVFEQERQILLEDMASQLRTVLERVGKVNDNLLSLSSGQAEIVQVSNLWQSHHTSSSSTFSERSNSNGSLQSSLSAFPKSPRQSNNDE